ncbi:zinc metallochaperone AztD [Desertivibrio insolitus]|uniref:zinc metallochaperone AztD n=1 Tax=Herbiconiux sp. SYSU D00978 TaxID=2812562 RepID=UPI001A9694ED|nr:zinc metallochaperone AztD [Herbiconiux sp. SYSU D00978]
METQLHRRAGMTAALLTTALLATGCATSTPAVNTDAEASATQVDQPTPRITLTYDGGIFVLDGETLELEGDLPIDGFTRVNAAGDGRHVLVTTAEGFQVLDAGTWTEDGSSYVAEPELTDLVFEADTAGHVVRHAGKTILYADGTSETTIFETDDLLETDGELPETEVVPAPEAHHGVSIELEDGTLLTTVGNSESRSGIRVLNEDREEVATSDECPSVHGEGTAANEVVVFGCSNGALVYDDGEITKITAPDEFGRMGNAYVTENSTIAVGDYKTDPDAEGYVLTKLTLIDTEAKTMQIVDLPEGIGYTFRDVARGPHDEIVLLGTDGQLHILDETTGAIEQSYPVIEAWEGPAEWQDPHPALTVNGHIAYVTEPASNGVHAVDIETGGVLASAELDGTPNEIAVAAG